MMLGAHAALCLIFLLGGGHSGCVAAGIPSAQPTPGQHAPVANARPSLTWPGSLYNPCFANAPNGGYLFGGRTVSVAGGWGHTVNALWRWDEAASNFTLISGDVSGGQPGNWVNKSSLHPAASPGSRMPGTCWFDTNSNSFWLFGGQIFVPIIAPTSGVATERYEYFSDLWRFDVGSSLWGWMDGPQLTNQRGSWTRNASAFPAARWQSGQVRRSAAGTKIAIFGGIQVDAGDLGDVWEVDVSSPASPVWTWIGGAAGLSVRPVVDTATPGKYSPNNVWGAGSGIGKN
jgi:hypothetical protein